MPKSYADSVYTIYVHVGILTIGNTLGMKQIKMLTCIYPAGCGRNFEGAPLHEGEEVEGTTKKITYTQEFRQ